MVLDALVESVWLAPLVWAGLFSLDYALTLKGAWFIQTIPPGTLHPLRIVVTNRDESPKVAGQKGPRPPPVLPSTPSGRTL